MKIATHLPGGPCWAELSTPDVGVAHAFYGGLFGWEGMSADSQAAPYMTLTLHGELTGAMRLAADVPASWDIYFTSQDLAWTSTMVEAAGGRVVSAARQVLDRGSSAYFRAPDGAGFGAWQPGARAGVGLMREPGALAWFELNTPDPGLATSFYTDVFGWLSTSHANGDFTYTDLKVPGATMEFGGITPRLAGWPKAVPIQWTPYFAVQDADATAAKASELGGAVASAPRTVGNIGRIAALLDPHGAAFSAISAPPASGQGPIPS
ncbi:MAG: uncharacterized protein QOG42_28 [Solirubrobacteraceae bacterium]|jgi:predicted enzyme related to lactoylglutathione lyase|nr:uncharacterized protein [Solirubrobacteraceae bacterium]